MTICLFLIWPTTTSTIGNEERYFSIDPATGRLFVIKEIDREKLAPVDFFTLTIEATQKDNPLKAATCEVYMQHIINNNCVHSTPADLI